jgi:hypothetical protein
MNLEAALTLFEIDGAHRKFTSSDRIKIKEVASELGLDNQDFAINKSYVYDIDENDRYSRDHGILHIHPTMLVARKEFKGSINRGPIPYELFPHFLALDHFMERSVGPIGRAGSNTVLCASSCLMVPAGFECICGEVHRKVELF